MQLGYVGLMKLISSLQKLGNLKPFLKRIDFVSGNNEIRGKQISLFPKGPGGPVIKLFVV